MAQAAIDKTGMQAAITARHRSCAGIQWGIIALGIPLTLIGPLMMTMIIWFAALLFGYWWPWLMTFGIVTAVFVPILFWYAGRGSANMLTEAVKSGNTDAARRIWRFSNASGSAGGAALMGAMIVAPRATAAGFQEIFVTGPRQIVKAGGKLRVLSKLKDARHDRAAEMLAALLAYDRGVEVARLLKAKEQEEDIWGELGLLLFHDWIGVSQDAKRAWALTEAKRALGLGAR